MGLGPALLVMTSGPEGLAPPLTPAAHRWRSPDRVIQSALGLKAAELASVQALVIFFTFVLCTDLYAKKLCNVISLYFFFLVGTDIGYTLTLM